ncbi:MAG: cupredoxin domain-containing protein [Parcubacteria group bacterium]|nr:cupredoxin domain-containing protein [Parcubacteria group bacterium]
MATYDIKAPQKPSPQEVIKQKMEEIPNRKVDKIEKKIKDNPKIETPQTSKRSSSRGGSNLLSIISLVLGVLLIAGIVLTYFSLNSRINSISQYVQNQEVSSDLTVQDEKITVLEKAFSDLKGETESMLGDLGSDISGTDGFASKSSVTNLENILKVTDTDNDGLNDYEEVMTYDTNPNLKDTDKDGFTDKQEIDRGFNPKGEGKLQQTNSTDESTEEKKTVQITASDYVFNPNAIELSVGQTARIELTSIDNDYTFTIDELKIDQEIEAGGEQIVELTPDKAGTYTFYSSNRADVENNMKGTLTVKATK